MKTTRKSIVLSAFFVMISSPLAQASSLFPTDLRQAQALGSRFLNPSQAYRFEVGIDPVLVEGPRVEIGGTIIGMTGAIRFDEKMYRRIEAADDDLLEIIQIVSSEERGACGFYREERLHLRVRLIDHSRAQVVGAQLVVGETSDRCHLSLDEISAQFRPDPREMCENILPIMSSSVGASWVFTRGSQGNELRGFEGNLQERSHPQSSLPVPASLIAETPEERIYFVPRLGSTEPRAGLLLSCEIQQGSVRRLAERTKLTCSDIPPALRLKATWLDCR